MVLLVRHTCNQINKGNPKGLPLFICYEKGLVFHDLRRREWGDEPKRTQWVIKRGEEVAVVEKTEQSVATVLREPQQGNEKSHPLPQPSETLLNHILFNSVFISKNLYILKGKNHKKFLFFILLR